MCITYCIVSNHHIVIHYCTVPHNIKCSVVYWITLYYISYYYTTPNHFAIYKSILYYMIAHYIILHNVTLNCTLSYHLDNISQQCARRRVGPRQFLLWSTLLPKNSFPNKVRTYVRTYIYSTYMYVHTTYIHVKW